ncbi:MAG: hypothetical protein CMJ33_01110 [Phycisphaerae bacterium]|nr:hypothetical protein [Phycisphaerae bacterium]
MRFVTEVMRSAWPPVLVLLMLVAGVLLGEHLIASHAWDQNLFHIQVVRQFEMQWPSPDLSDYSAATGPLYHLVMAGLGAVFGNDLETLRVLSVIFGVGVVVVVAGVAGRFTEFRAAAFLTMPFAASIYVVASATHVHTDDFAWMASAFCIACLLSPSPRPRTLVLAAVAMFVAVGARQNFIWLAGPVVFAGLLDLSLERSVGAVKRLTALVAVTIPSLGLLITFIVLWGGLVPPHFQDFHVSSGVNWIAPGYALALIGLYAPFFLLAVPEVMSFIRTRSIPLVIAGVAGVLFVLIPPSAPEIASGRTGGPLWTLSGMWVLADRSLSLACFAGFGAMSLVIFWSAIATTDRRRSWAILACALAATTATQMANAQSFQRYFDTPTLIFLCWTLAMILGDRRDAVLRASLGPTLLAVVLASLLVVRLVAF